MIFKTFPENPESYSDDVRPIVKDTIDRYGMDEWVAGVLTTAIHGHLGIYAIIGVKMGIKAVEYLGSEAGHVKISSSAGLKPPVSCLNDGLQVSTEATLGHGLIESLPTDNPQPYAVFSSDEKTIEIKLKNEIKLKVKQEIEGAVQRFGHSSDYWEYVRKLAIRYWKELDRNTIFDITEK